ncbi:glycine cleavage system protein GcvH [Nocardioides marmoriginsengisoli]|uniref:Glycine cleavage system H protein n=1 Tax=Nocardioides marmoriginsengisoli TaxID=661483 RepID=A0A3N0CGN6_9ACTN|nr:glycine cleavage system protein GcvH [Nocardioides marmoriginsengisoli]RNL62598.1 glycine cleavage system protein GcvH [Nocardioides marmoriginsengisoli]
MAPSPADLKYTAEHEWLDVDGTRARVGITRFAADALGDIVFVELPEVGALVTTGSTCGELESTKSVNELFAPADGEVVAVNHAAQEDPGLVNSDPYGAGWLFELRISRADGLLDAAAYDSHVGER